MTSIIKVDQIQLADGTAPTAADLGFAAGSVLQVQSVIKTDTDSVSMLNNDSTYIPDLELTITPKAEGSHFLIMVRLSFEMSSTDNYNMGFYMFRNAAAINVADAASGYLIATTGTRQGYYGADASTTMDFSSFQTVDKTSYTGLSPIAYKLVGIQKSGSTQTMYINRTVSDTSEERFTSELIIQEIAQ